MSISHRILTGALLAPVAASVVNPAPAHADLGDQLAKLLPDDGAAEDGFGRSVAISPDSIGTAIVGAWADDDYGYASGSAYLFDATGTPETCQWDLNGDGSVGILDLLALLAVWGSDPGGPPDFEGDGNVGILDLLTLLANWGPCA